MATDAPLDTLLTTEPRFWSKVRRDESGCWVWTAAIHGGGYGNYWDGVTRVRAHRHAYEALIGPIPDGLQIDHLCRNRACVNPDHLEPVTQRENLLRGETIVAAHARKTHCINGHEFTPENTGRDRGRRCLTCKRERRRYIGPTKTTGC